MDVRDRAHGNEWGAVAEENRVGKRIGGVVTMHSARPPRAPVEIALRKEPAGTKKKDEFAIAAILELHAEAAKLVVSQNLSAGPIAQAEPEWNFPRVR